VSRVGGERARYKEDQERGERKQRQSDENSADHPHRQGLCPGAETRGAHKLYVGFPGLQASLFTLLRFPSAIPPHGPWDRRRGHQGCSRSILKIDRGAPSVGSADLPVLVRSIFTRPLTPIPPSNRLENPHRAKDADDGRDPVDRPRARLWKASPPANHWRSRLLLLILAGCRGGVCGCNRWGRGKEKRGGEGHVLVTVHRQHILTGASSRYCILYSLAFPPDDTWGRAYLQVNLQVPTSWTTRRRRKTQRIVPTSSRFGGGTRVASQTVP